MFMGSNYCVFFIVNLSKALIEGFQTRVGYCLSWRCREARSWSDPICQSCHISKGGIFAENEILRNTLKYIFQQNLKQIMHFFADLNNRIRYNWKCISKLLHTDIQGQHSIWLPSAFLILQWMWELEWAKHILDFPTKECKNVKSNITILWDVPLEFRNWYPFIRPESDHCIPLLVTIPTPVK